MKKKIHNLVDFPYHLASAAGNRSKVSEKGLSETPGLTQQTSKVLFNSLHVFDYAGLIQVCARMCYFNHGNSPEE